DNHGSVRAAFGSHNLRSLAYAVMYARDHGIADSGYELQMLYGMAEPIQAALRRLGMRLRVYAPVGELVPGMAYLVRRLLENTSNESFVRRRFAEGRDLDELLAPPSVERLPSLELPPPRPRTDPLIPTAYEPEPIAEWRRSGARVAMAVAVRTAEADLGLDVPALIGGREVHTPDTIRSVDPARPSVVVASSSACGPEAADTAIAAAEQAWE